MRKLFYLFVSLVVGLCICNSCEKIEQAEQKQEAVKKTEEVLKVWGVKKVEKPKQVEEKQEVVKAKKTEEVQKGNVTTPAPEATVEKATKTEEAVPEEKTTAVTAAADIAAGEEVYKGKGMCIMCHGADGSKPFKLTKLFTGEEYTVEEEKEWIDKEPQMKMLKNKLTEQDLINVNAYINQKLKK